MRRDWKDARAKVEAEGRCRVTGKRENLEAAHTAGRKYDREKPCDACGGSGEVAPISMRDGSKKCFICNGRGVETPGLLWVAPDEIVPLNAEVHRAYDAGELDLLPHLTKREQAAVVALMGLEAARIRLAPSTNPRKVR